MGSKSRAQKRKNARGKPKFRGIPYRKKNSKKKQPSSNEEIPDLESIPKGSGKNGIDHLDQPLPTAQEPEIKQKSPSPPPTPAYTRPTRQTPCSPSKKEVKLDRNFPIDFQAIRAVTRAYNRMLTKKTATTKTKKYFEK